MLVSDVFRRLSFGPFANIALGMDGAGDIAPNAQGKIIENINAALLRLYSRFVLSEKEIIIRMIEGITSYYLRREFSEFHCPDEDREAEDLDPDQIHVFRPRYIMDLLNPFQEDVIKILQVRDSLGQDLPLNDLENPWSVFTPAPDMLQIPTVITCQAMGVVYQARHPKLELGVLTGKITLPDTLHEALDHYVAYKVYSSMNGQDNSAKGQEYLAMYEAICTEVESRDLVNASVSTTNSIFAQRGFV